MHAVVAFKRLAHPNVLLKANGNTIKLMIYLLTRWDSAGNPEWLSISGSSVRESCGFGGNSYHRAVHEAMSMGMIEREKSTNPRKASRYRMVITQPDGGCQFADMEAITGRDEEYVGNATRSRYGNTNGNTNGNDISLPQPLDNTTPIERMYEGEPSLSEGHASPATPADRELAKAPIHLPERLREFWGELAIDHGGDAANRCLDAARRQLGCMPTPKQMIQVWQTAHRAEATDRPPDQWPSFAEALRVDKRREKDPGYIAPEPMDPPPF